MTIEGLFDDASSVMTVLSFATFMGIVAWTFLLHDRRDFDAAAMQPFTENGMDDEIDDGIDENDGTREH